MRTMLKKLIMGLIVSFVFILTGCQSKNVSDVVIDAAEDYVEDAVEDKKQEIKDAISEKANEIIEESNVPIIDKNVTLGNNTVTNEKRFSAKVLKVTDGDTIQIGYEKDGSYREDTVRIINIDTPEVHGPKAIQKFGPEASDFAKKVLSNKIVEIEVSAKDNPYDNYNRLLAYVFVDGTLYEEMIVKEGLARIAYVYEPDTKYLDRLEAAEDYARKNKRGIWSIPGYVTEDGYDMKKAS
jgi:micrococcal nuclease